MSVERQPASPYLLDTITLERLSSIDVIRLNQLGKCLGFPDLTHRLEVERRRFGPGPRTGQQDFAVGNVHHQRRNLLLLQCLLDLRDHLPTIKKEQFSIGKILQALEQQPRLIGPSQETVEHGAAFRRQVVAERSRH